jgi:hypothetical protein
MRFASPVLQERARVAEQAREARVRLSEGPPSIALQQFMTDRLRLLDTDVEAVAWDAHRTDDGTWQVTGTWRAGDTSGTTRWSFDLPSRTVSPADAATTDFAEGTRLVRVVPEVLPRARTVSVVREEPAAAPDDAPVHDTVVPTGLEMLSHDTDEVHVRDVHPPVGSPDDDRSVQSLLDEVADHDTVVLGRGTEEDEDPRARIPAWEDIVFGVRRHR